MDLPDGVLAYKLLKQAGLSETHEQLIRATITDLPYENMKLQLKQEILRTPYLTRHRTGQVERLMACDQIEAKIMKYHTLSGGGMSAVNLAKFNRKILLSSKSN